MFFVLGRAIALRRGLPLAHVGALLGGAIIFRPREMIDARPFVDPHDGVGQAMPLGFGFSAILAGSGRCDS